MELHRIIMDQRVMAMKETTYSLMLKDWYNFDTSQRHSWQFCDSPWRVLTLL